MLSTNTTRKINVPSAANVGKMRGLYVEKSQSATTNRALANAASTATGLGAGAIAITASMSAAHLMAASACGLAVSVPPLAPAILGLGILATLILRQRGLNKELASNLFFIKMEAERMGRVHNVIKVIADEHGIHLQTSNLSNCISALKSSIISFASNDTLRDIETFENFLKNNQVVKARDFLKNANKNAGKSLTITLKLTDPPVPPQTGGGFFRNLFSKKTFSKLIPSFPRGGFFNRWLYPSETLRQIVRDITIATVWFSIMLGEFDIFMRYIEVKNSQQQTNSQQPKNSQQQTNSQQPKNSQQQTNSQQPKKSQQPKIEWIKSLAFTELMEANRQLGKTIKDDNVEQFNYFYNLPDLTAAMKEVVKLADTVEDAKLEIKALTGEKVDISVQAGKDADTGTSASTDATEQNPLLTDTITPGGNYTRKRKNRR